MCYLYDEDVCGALVHVGPIEDDIKVHPDLIINDGRHSRIKFAIMNFE